MPISTPIKIQISPVRNELIVFPGQRQTIILTISNLSADSPLSGFLGVANFEQDELGRYSGADWLTLPKKELTIATSDKVDLPININVPYQAEPGGHYSMVYFQPIGTDSLANQPAVSETNTKVSARIASLVIIKVKGDIKEEALITSYKIPQFLNHGPIPVKLSVKNQGNYHVNPRGTITITNFPGDIAYQQSLEKVNIFPQKTHAFQNNLGKKLMIGRYRVDLGVTYGTQTTKILSRSAYVWIVPLREIFIFLLTLLIIILLFKRFYSRFFFRARP